MEISVLLSTHWVTIEKPLRTMRDIGKLRKKSVIGPENSRRSYHNIGTVYFSLRQFQNAVDNYVYYIDTTEIPIGMKS